MNLQQFGRIFLEIFIFSSCFTVICSSSVDTEDVNAKLLSTMSSYMDTSVNPCHNFYYYSCGNWKGGNPIKQLNAMYNQQLEMMLEDKESKLESHEIFRKLREFYASCKQPEEFTPYLDVIKPTDMDDWPADGEPWNPQEKWNVWSTVGRLAAFGFASPFFKWNLHLDRQDLTYHAEILMNIQTTWHLRSYGEKGKNQKIDSMVLKMYDFRDQLVWVQPRASANSTPVSEITVSELQEQVEHIDFGAFFSGLFGHDNYGDLKVTIGYIEYFRKVGEVVKATPQDVVIHTLKKMFTHYMTTQWNRGTSCIQTMRNLVPLAVDYMYEQEVYSHDRIRTDALIEKFFKAMQLKFTKQIQANLNEFSPEVVGVMKEKISNMKLFIGNLPQGVNAEFYAKYFENWEVAKNDFYGNHLRALMRKIVDSKELLKLPEFSPLLTYTEDTAVSPFYLSLPNAVVIPHPYLRFPSVHPELHEVFVYAELAYSVGEEMMRVLNNEALSHVAGTNKFTDAVECLKEHTGKPHSHMVEIMLNDTLADVGGFRLAHATYFKQMKISEFAGESEFSNRQLYFIRYAQAFCDDDSLDIYEKETRIVNVVAQSYEFKKAFPCQRRTKYCNLW